MATATAPTLRVVGEKAKRPKTGGRKPKKSIQQQLEEGEAASKIAGWHDDALLSPELAALYLGCSLDDLEEMRAPKEGGSERGSDGPLFGKNVKKGAVGQNQPVRYRLGALKQWWREREGRTSHEVAIKNNLLGWVSGSQPFFAAPLATGRHARDMLIAPAWDFDEPKREEMFEALIREEIRCVWLAPSEAAKARWSRAKAHRAFVKPWLSALRQEAGAVRAAIEASGIHEIAGEGSPSRGDA